MREEEKKLLHRGSGRQKPSAGGVEVWWRDLEKSEPSVRFQRRRAGLRRVRDDWRPRGIEQTLGLLKLLKQGTFRPVCGQEKTRQALSIDSDLGGTGLNGAEGFISYDRCVDDDERGVRVN